MMKTMQFKTRWFVGGSALLLALAVSCGDDEDTRRDTTTSSSGTGLTDQTGEECVAADDCFSTIARDDIQGGIVCLDRVDGGYCTHDCTIDDDCCAVEGECDTGETQVCGPFESTGMMMCFISCEDADISGADPEEHCAGFHADFACRSTGGGSANRKVCVPSGAGACTVVDDCASGFDNCCKNSLGDYRCYDAGGADGRDCL
jgi:hypothetical protein